jgi:hypothetical protein
MEKYVAYYRVSTAKQGQSGLGLEGQKAEIEKFTANCVNCVIAEFVEVESGKNSKRPEIQKAIAYAKEYGASLLIAKLDRLARNVHFVTTLMESMVKFKAVDMPEAESFTIHIIAAVAERGAKDISDKTKAGLKAKRERIAKGDFVNARRNPDGSTVLMKPDKNGNFRLGNPMGYTDEMRMAGIRAIREKAATNINTEISIKRIQECLAADPGISLAKLAGKLNMYNLRTPSGKPFSRFNVAYLRKLAEERQGAA